MDRPRSCVAIAIRIACVASRLVLNPDLPGRNRRPVSASEPASNRYSQSPLAGVGRCLLDAIRLVAAGDQLLSPAATRGLIQRVLEQPDTAAPSHALDALTDRERELVRWVATGLSNAEIAEQLVISPATVKTHINRAMAKAHCRDRAQLVVLAYETGMVAPGQTPT